MELGNKISELRKKANFSQEELAEKMNVTRQTISKWELNETTPDIKQAKKLAKIFNVSLDELANNNIKSIENEKISNTEKLAGLVLKGIKILGIIFLIILVIDVIALILFSVLKTTTITEESTKVEMNCQKGNATYMITFATDEKYTCDNCSDEMFKDIKNVIYYSDLELTVRNIENYFININGTCE